MGERSPTNKLVPKSTLETRVMKAEEKGIRVAK